MELSVLSEEKNKLKLGIKGETHTFCNMLREELWEDEHVKVAGYTLEHSLAGYPIMLIETDDKSDPRKSLQKAAERLKSRNKELLANLKKAIK